MPDNPAAVPARTLLLALLSTGCWADEPVLPGIPAEPLLIGTEVKPEGPTTSDGVAEAGSYQRPAGVIVDVHHLGGSSYRENRDILADQLGALLTVEDLAGDSGQRLHFERGTLQVKDDEIYMLRVPLPELQRRSQALEQLGFPAYVGRYVTLHREYRLNNTWDFRRIRMKRNSSEDELVVEVEAWHRVPGEPGPSR